MRKRDYYEILEVAREAPVVDIRRAYRRLARRYCPDVNPWDDRAPGLFAEIVEAYRVLADPGARSLYDRLGHGAFTTPREQPGVGPGSRGEDLHYGIDLDLEDALRGTTTRVDVSRRETCGSCAGSGGLAGQGPVSCLPCQGRPMRVVATRSRRILARCANCGGTGLRLPPPCPDCQGRGTVVREASIPVVIPPGVDTGAQVRLTGEGHAALAPGRPGDLIVITRVRPHLFYTRRGDHLTCEVPVTVPEAALGARIQVPTPDGPVPLTIPAGTQNGQAFRIRGRGCPRLGRDGQGDLLVAIRVMIPRNPDSMLEEVLRAMQRLSPGNPRDDLPGGARLWRRGADAGH